MRRLIVLGCLVLTSAGLASADTLTLSALVAQGLVERITCVRSLGTCTGRTPLAPNALAAAVGLPLPNTTQEGFDTAGRGWRVQSREDFNGWTVTLTPLGRALSRAELSRYPEPPAPVLVRPPVTTPVPRSQARCVVAVDVRGLGPFQRDMTSVLYDVQGHQLWPDVALIKGVSGVMVGDLQTYVTSEAALKPFGKVTRVRALRVQPNRMAPRSNVYTDAVLGPTSSAAFKKAGQNCRIVYLMDAK